MSCWTGNRKGAFRPLFHSVLVWIRQRASHGEEFLLCLPVQAATLIDAARVHCGELATALVIRRVHLLPNFAKGTALTIVLDAEAEELATCDLEAVHPAGGLEVAHINLLR